jgi:hypothetical protein
VLRPFLGAGCWSSPRPQGHRSGGAMCFTDSLSTDHIRSVAAWAARHRSPDAPTMLPNVPAPPALPARLPGPVAREPTRPRAVGRRPPPRPAGSLKTDLPPSEHRPWLLIYSSTLASSPNTLSWASAPATRFRLPRTTVGPAAPGAPREGRCLLLPFSLARLPKTLPEAPAPAARTSSPSTCVPSLCSCGSRPNTKPWTPAVTAAASAVHRSHRSETPWGCPSQVSSSHEASRTITHTTARITTRSHPVNRRPGTRPQSPIAPGTGDFICDGVSLPPRKRVGRPSRRGATVSTAPSRTAAGTAAPDQEIRRSRLPLPGPGVRCSGTVRTAGSTGGTSRIPNLPVRGPASNAPTSGTPPSFHAPAHRCVTDAFLEFPK